MIVDVNVRFKNALMVMSQLLGQNVNAVIKMQLTLPQTAQMESTGLILLLENVSVDVNMTYVQELTYLPRLIQIVYAVIVQLQIADQMLYSAQLNQIVVNVTALEQQIIVILEFQHLLELLGPIAVCVLQLCIVLTVFQLEFGLNVANAKKI